MVFLVLIIVVLLITICLGLYIKIEIIIRIQEDDTFQGISLLINSRFYKAHRLYDYSDPNLRLFESIIIAAIEHHQSGKAQPTKPLDLMGIIKQTVTGFPIRSLYELSRGTDMFRTLLEHTIVEKLEWVSLVGGRDALYTALGTGLCWLLKGIMISALGSQCNLRRIFLDVKPDFANPVFISNFKCILKIRLVHIIIIETHAIAIKVRWCMNGNTAGAAEPSH